MKRKRTVRRQERIEATPQTLAKLKPDPFPGLIAAGLLPDNAKSLAEDLAEAYVLRTAGLGYAVPGLLGRGGDSLRSEALQVAWFAWARTIYGLTLVRPHVFVEWASGARELDRAAAPTMARGLLYWSRDLAAAWKQVRPPTEPVA